MDGSARISGSRRTFSGETSPSSSSGACHATPRISKPSGCSDVHQGRVVNATVVQDLDGVTPALPAGEPVDREYADQRQGDSEFLVHLPGCPGRGILVRLDHTAGQLQILLVADLTEQHPASGVPDDHVRDHPLLRQRRVHQGGPARQGVRARVVLPHPVHSHIAAFVVHHAAPRSTPSRRKPDRMATRADAWSSGSTSTCSRSSPSSPKAYSATSRTARRATRARRPSSR